MPYCRCLLALWGRVSWRAEPAGARADPARAPAALCCAALRRQIVKQIDLWGIDMCFVVGGNGGNAGAAAVQVGVPVGGFCEHGC